MVSQAGPSASFSGLLPGLWHSLLHGWKIFPSSLLSPWHLGGSRDHMHASPIPRCWWPLGLNLGHLDNTEVGDRGPGLRARTEFCPLPGPFCCSSPSHSPIHVFGSTQDASNLFRLRAGQYLGIPPEILKATSDRNK